MVTIVTPAIYDNPCAEVWFDPSLLNTPDPDLAEQAAVAATWALWTLSGERFHGEQCWVEDYRTVAGYCTIQLRQWPVTEVSYVSVVDMCDTPIAATGLGTVVEGWCNRGGGEVRVCCGGGYSSTWGFAGCNCGSGRVVRVHYKTGNNLPPGADRAALRLADEYVLAATGGDCQLPERITSVTRQGVSWTILDPQDFLADGLSGIGPIDQWLAQVGLRSRWASFTDPLRSVPLVASTVVGCGGEDCFADLADDT
jgi:hypothetical protein